MIIIKSTKKSTRLILVLILCCLAAIYQGCKKKRSEMASILYKRTHEKVFKDIDPDEFAAFFKKELRREKAAMNNPQLIVAHYEQNDYEPDFVLYRLWDGGLDAMVANYRKANEHGLDPNMFKPDEISALMAKFTTKDGSQDKGRGL